MNTELMNITKSFINLFKAQSRYNYEVYPPNQIVDNPKNVLVMRTKKVKQPDGSWATPLDTEKKPISTRQLPMGYSLEHNVIIDPNYKLKVPNIRSGALKPSPLYSSDWIVTAAGIGPNKTTRRSRNFPRDLKIRQNNLNIWNETGKTAIEHFADNNPKMPFQLDHHKTYGLPVTEDEALKVLSTSSKSGLNRQQSWQKLANIIRRRGLKLL